MKKSKAQFFGRRNNVGSLFIISLSLSLLTTITPTMSLSTSSNNNRPRPRNIVVVGGGVQGTSVAYHIAKKSKKEKDEINIIILESKEPASAASGKGGGFMARSWGDGSPTEQLHHLAFDMYEELATKTLNCKSYRKLPVLSVSPGYKGIKEALKNKNLGPLMPKWLDGNVGRISALGYGDDTAQITPKEFVTKMLENESDRIKVVLGTCTGIETDQGSERGSRKVTAVTYKPRDSDGDDESSLEEDCILPADDVIISAGPWSCEAEKWFKHSNIQLPMEGVKSTSIVWDNPNTDSSADGDDDNNVDATALFCGEDNRYGTHLEVYPRPDGTIYICGIGGSDYITKEELQNGAYREECNAKDDRVDAAKSSFEEMSSLYKSKGTLQKVQACMRPCPPDAMPYMGKILNYEGAYINAGHNCWGIAWAPACGKSIAELVLDGESKCIDLRPFSPDRFTPKNTKRGGRGRKQQGMSVGEQW